MRGPGSLNDAVLGLQLFNAGRRPFELDGLPSGVLARGTGIHTEPTMVEETAELDAVARLCEVALRLDRLLMVVAHGPGRYSIDARLRRPLMP